MSKNMNVGEYGLALNINVLYNLTAATSLQLDIYRPDGTVVSRTTGVTAPNTPLVTEDAGTYPAGQYASYAIQPGDAPIVGAYSVRVIYTDVTKRLVSEFDSFMVNP